MILLLLRRSYLQVLQEALLLVEMIVTIWIDMIILSCVIVVILHHCFILPKLKVIYIKLIYFFPCFLFLILDPDTIERRAKYFAEEYHDELIKELNS